MPGSARLNGNNGSITRCSIEAEMAKMIAAGVDKLMSMQNADGGWGWFSGYGEFSYPHTTAVVVHGLLVAKSNGAAIPDPMLNSGIGWLLAYERKQSAALQLYVEREALRKEGRKLKPTRPHEKAQCDALDAFVRMVLGEAKRDSEPMLAFLYRDRLDLPVYAKCLVGLEHHRKGDEARRDEWLKMISQFLKRDAENQTAYLDLQNTNYWWNWYGSEVEAHAWYLKLLAAVQPERPRTPAAWSNTWSTTASTRPIGNPPATRPMPSRRSPPISRPAARTRRRWRWRSRSTENR